MGLREDVMDVVSEPDIREECEYIPIRTGIPLSSDPKFGLAGNKVYAVLGDILIDSVADDQRGLRRVDATIGHFNDTFAPEIGDRLRTVSDNHTYTVERVITTKFGVDPVVHVLDLVSA